MKRIIIISLFLLAMRVTFANKSNYFKVDKIKIYNEFSDINSIENQIITSNCIANSLQINELKHSQNNIIANQFLGTKPIDFPFLWGCCLGPVGWATVLIVTNRQRTPSTNAFKGCVVWGGWMSVVVFSGYKFGWWLN